MKRRPLLRCPLWALLPLLALPGGAFADTDRVPGAWLVGAVLVIALQSVVLIALLARRRHRAGAEDPEQRGEFLHLSRLAIVGELTASIAHEINQPLGAILSNADAAELLLDSGVSNPDLLRQILADIRRDDIRASEVISHIRALLGKRTAEPRAVDLALVGGNALRLIGPEAERRGVALECRVATALPPVMGDQVQLEQVLLNLLLNGMQAMADTPMERRRLQLCIDAAGDGQLVMAVSDFGEGIPPDRLTQLFDSFYTTREKGMGLGLAITRSIVEAHGGSIDAANRPDSGAVFRVVLPAAGHLPIAETYHEQIRSDRSYC